MVLLSLDGVHLEVPLLLDKVVCKLSDLCLVDSEHLLLLGRSERQSRDQVHDEQDNASHSERVGDSCTAVCCLVSQLDPVVVQPTTWNRTHAIERRDVVGSEESGEEVADYTADAVLRKDIESVIDLQPVLDLRGIIASRRTDDTEHDGRPWRDVTGCRRDGDEPGNSSGTETHGGPLTLKSVIKKHPCHASDTGGQIGHDTGHDGTHVGAESRTAVKSEPAEPEEDGSEDDVCDVVGSVVEFSRAVTSSFAEHDGVGQGGGSGRDVDRGTTSKVEGAEFIKPAGRIPSPAGERVVDERAPDKDENDAGKQSTTFGSSTDGESWGDGSEHALVDSVEDIRETSRAGRR